MTCDHEWSPHRVDPDYLGVGAVMASICIHCELIKGELP